ncbi:MAG: hypothetical protein KIS86_06340 [Devosia sp.]|nr:hypothetical protein [Devosia sp.]
MSSHDCPICKAKARVIDKVGDTRRIKCERCNILWNTVESVVGVPRMAPTDNSKSSRSAVAANLIRLAQAGNG